jgi:mitogen-activated protein kinase 15
MNFSSQDGIKLMFVHGALPQFNPNKRLSAAEAMRHPYVAQFNQQRPEDEPLSGVEIKIPINDNHKYSISEYRDKLYAEILKKKKELYKKLKAREEEKERRRAAAAAASSAGKTPSSSGARHSRHSTTTGRRSSSSTEASGVSRR